MEGLAQTCRAVLHCRTGQYVSASKLLLCKVVVFDPSKNCLDGIFCFSLFVGLFVVLDRFSVFFVVPTRTKEDF